MVKPISKKKVTKPKVKTRPTISHGGKKIEIPLMTGPVGASNPDLQGKFQIFNAPADVQIVDYYLSQLAEIKFLSVSCAPVEKPNDKVIQAADVVQCWDTNRDAAIKAFQNKMTGLNDLDEIKYGIIKPDGPTLKALVDYGDIAEKLAALKTKPSNAIDYTHMGGFDRQLFANALEQRKDLNIYFQVRFNSTTVNNAWSLVQLMQADYLIIDIRWMAYMLATAFWEASHTVKIQVPKLDKKKQPMLNKDQTPILINKDVWEVMVPIDEISPADSRRYKAPVKVQLITAADMAALRKAAPKIPDVTGGAWVIEQDGNQFVIASNGRQVWQSKNAAMGANFSEAESATFKAATGVEQRYYGRGYVQLTWWANYISTAFAIGMGFDLLLDPELVKQPAIAYKIMAHCMRTGDGFANNHKFADYFYGGTKNYAQARRMVNGVDHKDEIADIAVLFERILFEAKQ